MGTGPGAANALAPPLPEPIPVRGGAWAGPSALRAVCPATPGRDAAGTAAVPRWAPLVVPTAWCSQHCPGPSCWTYSKAHSGATCFKHSRSWEVAPQRGGNSEPLPSLGFLQRPPVSLPPGSPLLSLHTATRLPFRKHKANPHHVPAKTSPRLCPAYHQDPEVRASAAATPGCVPAEILTEACVARKAHTPSRA